MGCDIGCSDNGITTNAIGYRTIIPGTGDCPWTGTISPGMESNACTCKWSMSGNSNVKIQPGMTLEDILKLYDNEDTTLLGFSDGWIPPRTVDPKRNQFSGTYDYRTVYDSTGNTMYELDVVPTFGALTWTGAAEGCGKNTPSSCLPTAPQFSVFYPTYAGVVPKQWAGYSTDATIAGGGATIQSGCLKGCESGGNLVLCTRDSQMRPKSCPGYNSFTKPPKVVPVESYYAGLDIKTAYPRGKGKCLYQEDAIQTPNDMKNLLDLRNANKIHPGLADELAKKYCYATSDDNKCGINDKGQVITHCNNLAIEMNNLAGITPCKDWINTLKQEGKGEWIDDQSRQWCNDPDNALTPLCDCFMARYNNGSMSRTFYNFIKGYDVPIIKSNVPDVCWYTPCMANSYALKSVVDTCNIDVAQICQNIIYAPDADAAFINDNKQSLSCNIDVQSSGSTVASLANDNLDTTGDNTQNINESNFNKALNKATELLSKPVIYIPLIILTVVYVLSMIIRSFRTPSTLTDAKVLELIESRMKKTNK